MDRPRFASAGVVATAMLMLATFTIACSSPPEEPLLRQFFRASQLRDNTTLSNFAAVTFDPRTDGVVTSFEIVSVSPERRQPLRIKALAQAHEEARAANTEISKKMKAYQDSNLDAIGRVLKAEDANRPTSGRDAAVQAAWRKWRDDVAVSAKAMSEARAKLNADRPIAELSLQNIGQAVDVTTTDGEMIAKDVTVDAQVRMPGGGTEQKQMVITLQRAVMNVPGKAAPVTGRWVLTKISRG